MNRLFEQYPWLKTSIIVVSIFIIVGIFYGIGHHIWYQYFDTVDRPGKVESFSWKLSVDEYHLVTHTGDDWSEYVPTEAYNVRCSVKDRTISVQQPDGSYKDKTVPDSYCYYFIDQWDYFKSYVTNGTDKNPHYYSDHGPNTSTVEYRQQPGTFTVYFSSVEYVDGQFSFNYDQQTWSRFDPGMKVIVGVNRHNKVPFAPKLPQ